MCMENKISIVITEATQKQAMTQIAALKTVLAPVLIALTPQQRQSLLKMGDRTLPFVDKSMEYAQRSPALMPKFLDMKEWEKDAGARKYLTDMQYALTELL